MVAAGTAMNAVLCTEVVVTLGALPVVNLVLFKNLRPEYSLAYFRRVHRVN